MFYVAQFGIKCWIRLGKILMSYCSLTSDVICIGLPYEGNVHAAAQKKNPPQNSRSSANPANDIDSNESDPSFFEEAIEDAYSSGHLVMSHLGLAFFSMFRPFSTELVMFPDCKLKPLYLRSTAQASENPLLSWDKIDNSFYYVH